MKQSTFDGLRAVRDQIIHMAKSFTGVLVTVKSPFSILQTS